MRVHLLAVGRLKAGPERDLGARYLDRFARSGPAVGLEMGRVVEIAESRAGNADTRKREEAAALTGRLPEDALVLLLDEHGKALDSPGFAKMIGGWRDAGRRDAALVIGGADGHGDALKAEAGAILSFGRMTWPHQLVRIMASEQLYRAATILSGHPYHRS